MEELFARVTVVDVLLNGAARLGAASDSLCEITVAPQERLSTLRLGRRAPLAADKGFGWAGTRLLVVLTYGSVSSVGGFSGMMTRPAERKINDVRYRQRGLEMS